ncbi:MAG: hypothetical protein B2I17_02585 [Thermoplasmatales archaeon B_DKE]|nr:MAG: hypothetical protein B2I17_02585 [Thermoplasmatales archaeon B_DKE]
MENDIQFPEAIHENILFENLRTLFVVLGLVSVMSAGVVMHQSPMLSYLLLSYAFFIIIVALFRR